VTDGLDSERRGVAVGDAEQIVVFLHGYGANGADLIGLADSILPHMPNTVFVAPDAPEGCPGNPGGFQWMSIPWMDGSSEEAASASLRSSSDDLNNYLDQMLEAEGLTEDRMILFGFSQGTMMSLHIAPRRADQLAGVVCFSGRLLEPEHLADEILTRPPILLLHGDEDEVVPYENLPAAAEVLQAAGIDVFVHIMKGTAHGIAPDGLSVALAFMREQLDLE
jgi:phospholipase/carboxylesterase